MFNTAKTSLSEFSANLRSLLADRPLSRPFICDGSPLYCQVMLVGFNAATPMQASFFDFWDDDNGFELEAWQETYTAERQAKGKTTQSTTRRNLNFLRELVTFDGLLETNIFDHPSATQKDLAKDQQESTVFDFLIETVQPRILISHGNEANQHLAEFFGQAVNKDQWVKFEHQGQTLYWYATSHFSRGWSYDRLGTLSDEIMDTHEKLFPRTPIPIVFANDPETIDGIKQGKIPSGYCTYPEQLTMRISVNEANFKFDTIRQPYVFRFYMQQGDKTASYIGMVRNPPHAKQVDHYLFTRYQKNVCDLKEGLPYHGGGDYRKVHYALKKAWDNQQTVYFEILGNPPEWLTIDQYKAELIREFNCKGDEDWQLNQ